ncbi:uncharacterized protein LOC135226376 [Macrobrachium nipponense]|uniref:uncharacterized protein LOC135226376 n=1 Tax=Macrobrachium nipponense TaxID=159736 RepID=UPI0030C8AF3F
MESAWFVLLIGLLLADFGNATYGSRPANVCQRQTITKQVVAPQYITSIQLVTAHVTISNTQAQYQYQTQFQNVYVTRTLTYPVYYTQTVQAGVVITTAYIDEYVTQTVPYQITKTINQLVYVSRPCNFVSGQGRPPIPPVYGYGGR